MTKKTDALDYHRLPTPGKVSVVPTKPCDTAVDLALAYSPGVAEPCLEIAANPGDVFKYTSKGNLVAVISNGTAVLGLGDIGALASKPVMEGKGVLFKTFADIDVFDLEVDAKTVAEFVQAVKAIAPTFGGINLEDIKAPECFEIETQLQELLDIPVFHDDQHGTAIIAAAALLNALEITNRSISQIRLVVNGAGAAGIACAKILLALGLSKQNLILCDSVGVVYKGREKGMNKYKEEFAVETSLRTLADALKGADAFFGVSAMDQMTPEMLLSMAPNPIVFAMANPDPEIDYNLAVKTRKDVIMATGRSDFPNQVNNVLGFPYLFRGALDVRARKINEEMKLAAVHALAKLAKESVPDSVRHAYGNAHFSFGPGYLIPKPFDPRTLYSVAPAVAKAAIDSGVARTPIDIEEYTLFLKGKQNRGRTLIAGCYKTAKEAKRKRVAYAEGSNERVLTAAVMARDEGLAHPVLLGNRERISYAANRLELDISGIEIVDPLTDGRREDYAQRYFKLRGRRGVTISDARRALEREHIFANMLLVQGDVDGLICGVDQNYPEMVKPILQIVGLEPKVSTAAGVYVISIRDRMFFVGDTTMNIEMTPEKLAEVAVMTGEFARSMGVEPRVALLSYSNFGSVSHPSASIVSQAAQLAKAAAPDMKIDGEMWADVAVTASLLKEDAPFSSLEDAANVLIFPDMQSGNIAYKLLQRLGGAKVVGPAILGLEAPAHVMQRHAGVDEIFNMTVVTVAQAARVKPVKSPVKLRVANA